MQDTPSAYRIPRLSLSPVLLSGKVHLRERSAIASFRRHPESAGRRIRRVVGKTLRAARSSLKQRTLPPVGRDPEVLVGQLGRHPAAGSAVQKANLDQKGLVDLFDRVGFFRQRCGQRIHATGPPWYFSMIVSSSLRSISSKP